MNPRTRTTVILLFIAWCIDYIDRSVISVALPAIGRDLDLDHGQLGLAVSVFFIAYAAVQIPGGLLADRFGAMRIAVVGLLAWSLFTGLTAAAASFGTLILIRVLFGLSQGIFPAAGMKLLAERSTPQDRMTANGWVNSSNAVGGVLAMILAAVLIPLIGWRGLFVAVSVLGLVVTFSFVTKMPAPLQEVDLAPNPSSGGSALLKVPTMWLYVLAFFGYDVLIWGTNSWFASYLQEERGLSASSAALLGLPAGLTAAVIIVLSGRVSDRIGGRIRPLVIPGMTIAGILIILLPHVSNLVVFVLLSMVAVGCSSPAYIGAFSIPLKQLNPRVAGIGSGMILTGGMVAGIVAPAMFGFVVDANGWNAAWACLAIGSVIAVIAAYLAPRNAEEFRARVPSHLLFDPSGTTKTTKEATR